jgi:hypothetical protein
MKRADWMTIAFITAIVGPGICFATVAALIRWLMAPSKPELPRGHRKGA